MLREINHGVTVRTTRNTIFRRTARSDKDDKCADILETCVLPRWNAWKGNCVWYIKSYKILILIINNHGWNIASTGCRDVFTELFIFLAQH